MKATCLCRGVHGDWKIGLCPSDALLGHCSGGSGPGPRPVSLWKCNAVPEAGFCREPPIRPAIRLAVRIRRWTAPQRRD